MDNLGVDVEATKLTGLFIELSQKYHDGTISLTELENFIEMSEFDRQKVFGSIDDVSDKFVLLEDFLITTPLNYDHKSQLKTFSINHKKDFYFYDNRINQEFNRVTRLLPGKTY